METINIIFSSDDKYALYLGVSLCSLFENKTEEYIANIYVIDGGISLCNKDRITLLAKKYGASINFISIANELFDDFYVSDHITKAAYYRILIPYLLPRDIKKALYLDCDIVVLGDILNLYDIDIDSYSLAAVKENISGRHLDLGMPKGSNYFNSGVMLINLEKWRQYHISEKVITFIKENPGKIKFWDQDALNAILYGDWLEINHKFNFLTSMLGDDRKKNTSLLKDAVILHYSSSSKPWNYLDNHPFKYLYFYYLAKLPWRAKKFTDISTKKIMVRFVNKYFSKQCVSFIKSAIETYNKLYK